MNAYTLMHCQASRILAGYAWKSSPVPSGILFPINNNTPYIEIIIIKIVHKSNLFFLNEVLKLSSDEYL